MFTPFQRQGDYTSGGGLGLGLAIAHGFAQAMDATISPADTPGGGLTMTVSVRQTT
jgi:two-component system sensor histidine kinase KdpD